MNAAALLHGEVHGTAVRRPLRRALAIINYRADFATIAAVSVHHPDVRVFHGGLAVGQSAARAAINDVLAIRRPKLLVLLVFGSRKTANGGVRDSRPENAAVIDVLL